MTAPEWKAGWDRAATGADKSIVQMSHETWLQISARLDEMQEFIETCANDQHDRVSGGLKVFAIRVLEKYQKGPGGL